jgi:hypothetical protein
VYPEFAWSTETEKLLFEFAEDGSEAAVMANGPETTLLPTAILEKSTEVGATLRVTFGRTVKIEVVAAGPTNPGTRAENVAKAVSR